MIPVDFHQAPGKAPAAEGSRPLRVVIADDHPFFRGRLAISLRSCGLDVVREVSNGMAAIEAVEAAGPDVVLMDLRMPLLSGLEATRLLTQVAPGRRILALSASSLEDEVADAILWGANGHVSKDRPVKEMIAAIQSVAAGRILLSPGTAQVLLRRIRGPAEPGPSLVGAPLVRRELDLLDRLAAGQDAAEIATATSVQVDAVDQDIEAILIKLRIEQRIQSALRDDTKGPDPGKG